MKKKEKSNEVVRTKRKGMREQRDRGGKDKGNRREKSTAKKKR